MKFKLISAERGKDSKGALVHFNFKHPSLQYVTHQIKLYQDGKGVWWPELVLGIQNCSSSDIQQLRVALAEILVMAANALSSEEAACIKTTADLVSNEENP